MKVKDMPENLRKSQERVGQIYPVLLDANGKIIDGKHRKKANKNWREFKLKHIKGKRDRLIARLHANCLRRHVSKEEKSKLLTGLAEETGWPVSKIAKKIGMGKRWVRKYLPSKYKRKYSNKSEDREAKSGIYALLT